ncbi:hypothetical protein OAN307_c43070 [Octadecabacter antarcticus 307]|uniref:Uncharacterized protein n=1 Tax=Octadecabacter antarcticus 307 TaxID=391626 RepID=M9RD56_9RHOB|nr:hypothetical protein [Octadecabacter antarcticus]AGI69693.1 hypothetical protein OAN307_c43070 [Octadecabacter antarcticus 307]
MKILTLFPPVAFAVFAMSAPAIAATLTGQQFMDLHAGKCVSYTGPSIGTQCYAADGTTQYDDTTYGTDTGTWEVRGNEVCERFVNDPGLDCGLITSMGGGTYSDGSYTWTIN